MSRVKQPSESTSNVGARLTNYRNTINKYMSKPAFDYTHGPVTARVVGLTGQYTQGGDSVFLVPFRIKDSNDILDSIRYYEILNDWTIDLSTSVIDTTTFTGGRVDGLSLGTITDYLIWAFWDSINDEFAGFGVTARPFRTGLTVSSGGTMGASVVLNITAGHGWRFSIDARVTIRASTAIGSIYNQGIITAITSTTISVDLDASYGAVTEPNSNLSGSLQILQLDTFKPRMFDSDQVYNNYNYSYIGNITTDSSSNITFVRKQGDWYRTNIHTIYISQSGLVATTGWTVCLARWLPFNAVKLDTFLSSYVTAGVGKNRAEGKNSSIGGIEIIGSESTNTDVSWSSGTISIRQRDCTVYILMTEISGAPTSTITAYITGWLETNF